MINWINRNELSIQDGCDSPPREKQGAESSVAMETNAELAVESAATPGETQKKNSFPDVSETRPTSTKNIMFPSLSNEMLSKIVHVRYDRDTSEQPR